MLQPRADQPRIIFAFGFLLLAQAGLAQYADEPYIVEPTPALKLNDEDLTTVLLLNNGNRAGHGRFLNVKPEVGILTSTARTFIQEGVTTEYATQVVGTTLENGRLYAQLLKKSSRVLYDKEGGAAASTVVGETALPTVAVYHNHKLQNHNDIIADKDWQIIDDHLLEENTFVRNTDYVDTPNGGKLALSTRIVGQEALPVRQEFANGSFSVFSSSSSSSSSGNGLKIAADKVQASMDLPTFTVKNVFAPSGFSWEGDEDQQTERVFSAADLRSPKQLYNQIDKNDARSFSTVTYYGFADFTTMVGDTVIVFTPSTSAEPVNQGQITSIKGEATLGAFDSAHISHVPITVTQDVIEPTFTMQMLSTAGIEGFEETSKDVREQTTQSAEEVVEETTVEAVVEEPEENSIESEPIIESSIIDLASETSTVTPSPVTTETTVSTPVTLSRPSDEEIRKIYASLASVQAEKKASEEKKVEEEKEEEEAIVPTTSEIKSFGGATTIFFEDDPFLDFQTTSTTQAEVEASRAVETTTTSTTTTTTEEPQVTEAVVPVEEATTVSTTTPMAEEETTTAVAGVAGVIEAVTEEQEEVFTEETIAESTTKKEEEETTTAASLETSSEETTTEQSLPKPVEEDDCIQTSQVFLTQLPKTLTYLTTFFIPDNSDDEKTSTSIESNVVTTFDIKETTKYHCFPKSITPTAVVPTVAVAVTSTADTQIEEETATPFMIVTEKTNVNESDETTESPEDDEEIELIYKTLYTTYTYLTTFFHDSTTSISSRKQIVTNVVTSTVNPTLLHAGLEVTDILSSMQIQPTAVVSADDAVTPTTKLDLIEIDGILREEKNPEHTEALDQSKIAKTYYTTYTYYTTIFVDGETEVMSRTEVYTNYVTGSISPTARELNLVQETVISDADNAVLEEVKESDSKGDVTMVTKVRSSSSDGDRQIIENVNKQANGLLEDQISSESNTEDLLPSPTLLLQTSYTTFTYYTTMYSGQATNIASSLETVTNVVTETLQPTPTVSVEVSSLPITYFTTFTYWTTLAKEGQITTISREETKSNVVSASSASESSAVSPTSSSSEVVVTPVVESIAPTSTDDQTIFYTTYTYYTTSYVGDEVIINSRFETATNVVAETSATPQIESVEEDVEVSTAKVEPVFVNPAESDDVSSTTATTPLDLTDVLSFDVKKIVDAEGISTIFYTTKVLATTIDGTATDVVSSTSSINVDHIKKALQPSTPAPTEGESSSRAYKTGLVRLIEGTMIKDKTTTLYQSKVIGTIIEGRYAQIIESTSSFLIEKMLSPSTVAPLEIAPTSTLGETIESSVLPDTTTNSPSSHAIESSISDDREDHTDANDEDEETTDENGRPKSRLSFASKKRTFTPVIRPFASRNRPQFAPKRKNILPSSATIITRSDITPTITATPALKSDSSRGRFSSSRKVNSGFSSSFSPAGSSSAPKRFSRPSKAGSSAFAPVSTFSGSSRSRLSSSRLQPSSAYGGGSSSRRGGVVLRASSSQPRSFSSAYAGNSRLRIKPSSAYPLESSQSTAYTTHTPDSEEDNTTPSGEGNGNDSEEVEVTTENSRRNQNPLLKFRRPLPAGRSVAFQPSQRNSVGQVSPRRNPLTQRAKSNPTTTTTTTTAKPRPRAFQRPAVAPFQNRPRPASSLFPPRGLFQPQQVNQELDEEKSKNDEENEGEDYDEEEEEEDGEQGEEGVNRKRRASGKKRSKRQVEYGARNNFRNRFRRPPPVRSQPAAEERMDEPEETQPEPSTSRPRLSSRYTGRSQKPTVHSISNARAIRPSKPSASSRAQFTLRENKDSSTKQSRTSNFRRPTPANNLSARRTSTSSTLRAKSPRLKPFGNSVTESSRSSSRSRPTSRGRSTGTRPRSRSNEFSNDLVLPSFDGTITVTHHIPTEITIPVVNGKITEYKNVVTAKVSTEVLGPNQYSTTVGRNGNPSILLVREDSLVNQNGATEITQFILHDTPTTSVIFTPTTIRGRKTSFSHVVPSTVYDVENIVSTIQPQLAANAPLANILLSQLLLGNINLQQQNLNPLLALGGATQAPTPQGPATPVTEFITKTTSYVTTVTNEMSTVIPLTFRGKEILTTIFDSSVNVITATEFLTETIVTTPTQQLPQAQQVNSLLLPLLLQQQLAQQPQPQAVLPIQNSVLAQLTEQNLLPENLQDIESNRIQKLDDFAESEVDDDLYNDEPVAVSVPAPQAEPPKSSRKKNRKHKHQHQHAAPAPTYETSVITLYVSGRRPGEFSTVLSTVVSGPDSSLHKRQIEQFVPVHKSATLDLEDFYRPDGSEIREYLLPASNDILTSSHAEETQSLESIIGDVSLWYQKTSSLPAEVNAAAATATGADSHSHNSAYFLV